MSPLRRFFERQHQEALPLWLWLFYPSCTVYGAVVLARQLFYRIGLLKQTRLSVPLISVGNLTTGGTGKTPVVIALSRYLIRQQKKVVILSRGYGAKSPQSYTRATQADYGDEAYLIQQAVPEAIVIVGRKRRENALKAISEYHPDVLILDDGFQYLPLHRDVDLVLVDGEQSFGNGCLLPLGPLREPFFSLERATAVAITKDCPPEQFSELMPLLQQFVKPSAFTLPPIHWPFEASGPHCEDPNTSSLQQKVLVSVCGIARPDTFLNSLSELGIHIPKERQTTFSDHHNYTLSDISALKEKYPDAGFITTEKDWVKLKSILPQTAWQQWSFIRIEPKIAPHHWQHCLAPISKALNLTHEQQAHMS